MSSNAYLDAYNEAVDWHLKLDLRAWGEMLSRHHRSLRRPYATGRPMGEAAVDHPTDDRQPGEQERPASPR